ncbi:hypothetical protein [Fructobacillus tropaeoli]|uniref:hypothetical protein n=1 Tax=Fructobacillus tropaeoli TaxID=709323 RepID=UPI001455DD5E|nr:hypothetical protein [Fructobacillus tropaeoli]NLS37382.1 hypothetical protein [Fructobacillus tropaeoli]CAK1224297.1 unnamed protein product [Fructobacillus tropaeoli]CAK1230526.1 unnamed protein product [Fructobacillus tropaeoli]
MFFLVSLTIIGLLFLTAIVKAHHLARRRRIIRAMLKREVNQALAEQNQQNDNDFDFDVHTPKEVHDYLKKQFEDENALNLGDGLFIDVKTEYLFYDLDHADADGNLYFIENFDEIEHYEVVAETEETKTIAANFLDFDDGDFVHTTLSRRENPVIGTSPADYFEKLLKKCVKQNRQAYQDYLVSQER